MLVKSIKNLGYSLLILGFSAMVTQIIVVRQVMAFFEGNELVIGLSLGMWMIITGLGARLTVRGSSLPVLHLFLAFFALLAVILIPLGRYLLVTPGVMAGLDITALVLLISLLPFCLFAGMLFPVLSDRFSLLSETSALHKAYALESIGSLLGGLLFSLMMVFLLDTWQCLTVIMIANLLAAALVYWEKGKKFITYFIAGTIMALVIVAAVIHPVAFLDHLYYRGQDIVAQEDTPYGRLVVTQLQDQISIYHNGIPLTQSNDIASREERVHYSMLLKPDAANVLMISGGMGGSLDEMLKYSKCQVDYVDVDPYLINEVKKYSGLPENPRIRIIPSDPVRFLRQTRHIYDVIIVNTPDPSSGLLNRMYTRSFFGELKRHLRSNGIIQIALSGGANYLSEEALLMHSVTYNSLKEEFNMVRLVPGGRNFFLAGDTLPVKTLSQAYKEAGVENQYVNPYYISEKQLQQRSKQILEQLHPEAGVNTNVRPLGYYLRINEWLGQFQVPSWLIPLILGAIVFAFLITLGPLNLGLFAGGFSAASAEFMLLLWLQVTYGYVYQLVGLVFTMFMAGLAAGSWVLPGIVKNFNYRLYLLLQAIMAIFLLILTLYIYISEQVTLGEWINLLLIFSLTFIAGLITGFQYSTAIRIRKSKAIHNASLSYSSDLAGSALGAIIVSVICLPLFGMYITGAGLAGACLLVMAILFLRRPR
jgi:spermidine synthase